MTTTTMNTKDHKANDREDSLASLCGQPAELLADGEHSFSTNFINRIVDEHLIKTHTLPGPIPVQHLLLNSNDEDIVKTCDQSTTETDTFVNVAEELGKSIDGVVVRCTGSSEKHQDCHHLTANEELVQKQLKRTLYRCTVCNEICDSMNDLISHQRVKHHKIKEGTSKPRPAKDDTTITKSNCELCSYSHLLGFYSCKNCTFSSTCPFVLENHMVESHQSAQIYSCPFCDHENRFYTAIEKHVLEQHFGPDRRIKPKTVSGRYATATSSNTRVTQLVNESMVDVNCEPLPRISLRASTLKVTYAPWKTLRTPFLCAFCSACFLRKDDLLNHMDVNHQQRSHLSLRCCICSLKTDTYPKLESHYKRQHEEEYDTFIMATCSSGKLDYMYVSSVLDPLSYKHTLTGKVDIAYYSSGDLWYRYHKRPNDAVLLSCGLCREGPMIKSDLLRHLEIHTRNWPYRCVSCHQCFKGMSEASEHTRTCCQLRPRLDETEYENQQAEILLLFHSHGMIIEGSESISDISSLRQFNTYQVLACNICLFTTVTLAELITHMVKHNDVQLHYCSDCDLIYRKMVKCLKCKVSVCPLPKKEAPWIAERTTLELMSRVAVLMDLQSHIQSKESTPKGGVTTTTKKKEMKANPIGTTTLKEVKQGSSKQLNAVDPTFVCPHCDFDSTFGELCAHYEAMHSDIAVCLECEDVPSFRIADYRRHMAENHPLVTVIDYATRRKDSKLRAKELIEQLGQRVIKMLGMKTSTSFMKCKLIDMKLSTTDGGDGVANARFVCRQCLHSTRNSDTFFAHIATHLQVAEFQCLLCQYVANVDDMKQHYHHAHKIHEIKLPELLPTSLQYRRYRKLVKRMLHKLEEENKSIGDRTASTAENLSPLKEEPISLDEKLNTCPVMEMDNESDSWSYSVFCPYCQLPTTDSNECRLHVELTHPRKQMALGLELRIPVSEQIGSVVTKHCTRDNRMSRKLFTQTYEVEVEDLNDDMDEMIAIPAGYEVQVIDPNELVNKYNTRMMDLYNHFSIFEVVSVTGSHLQCHLCDLAQTSFPALFEHWNREHLEITPYLCAYCGRKAKRPVTIVSHERRAHPKNSVEKKYIMSNELFELMFDEMDTFVKTWLRHNRVDSFVPEDMNLVVDCHVRLEDISKNDKYKAYFDKSDVVSDDVDMASDEGSSGSVDVSSHAVRPPKCSRLSSRPGWMSSASDGH